MKAAWGTLVATLALPLTADALSYACWSNETFQQCMDRIKREEAAANAGRPRNPYEPGPHPHPAEGGSTPPVSSASGGCNWLSAVSYAQVLNNQRGTRCNTPDSMELDVRNIANQPLKVMVYIQRSNGSWQKDADGTFNEGMQPGEKHNFFTCHSTGYYKVIAMPATAFNANRCTYPDYQGH